jgi:hypothetical protein
MPLNGLDISRLSAELSRTVEILNNLAMTKTFSTEQAEIDTGRKSRQLSKHQFLGLVLALVSVQAQVYDC